MRGLPIALGCALVVSVAFNVRSLVKGDPKPPAPKPCPTATVDETDSAAELASLQRRLDSCEKRGRDAARKAASADSSAKPVAAAPGGEKQPPTQMETLCEKAKRTLREDWERDKDKIVAGLNKSLADKSEQDKVIAFDLLRMQAVTGMSESTRSEMEKAYGDARRARVASSAAALAKNPPDYAALLNEGRGLISDEDTLMKRIAGPAAAESWRNEQTGSRTVLLALLATLAGQDWDESIKF